MEHEHEEQRKEEPQRIWGAKDSLKRHAKGRKSITSSSSEESPLLGHDRAREGEGSEGSEETSWEGHADFMGLTWWHKPSVCYLQFTLVQYILIDPPSGVLAFVSFLSLSSRSRRNHCTKTQSYPYSRMSIISRREIFSRSEFPFHSCDTW